MEHPTPAKLLKPEELVAKLLNMEDLPNTPLATITMTTVKHVTWKLVLAGDPARPDVFMANPGDQEINFQQGSVLMAFGKIKWRFADQPDKTQPNEIPYKLTDSNTFDYHDNRQIQDLKTVVGDQRKSKPGCHIAYYKMEERHDTCDGFDLTPTSHLRRVLQPVDFAANQDKQEVNG